MQSLGDIYFSLILKNVKLSFLANPNPSLAKCCGLIVKGITIVKFASHDLKMLYFILFIYFLGEGRGAQKI